eukprot:CFRG5078T1
MRTMKSGAYEIGSNLWSFSTRWIPKELSSPEEESRYAQYPIQNANPMSFVYETEESCALPGQYPTMKSNLMLSKPRYDTRTAVHGPFRPTLLSNRIRINHQTDSLVPISNGSSRVHAASPTSNRSASVSKKRKTIVIGATAPTCVDFCGNSHPPNKCKKLKRKRSQVESAKERMPQEELRITSRSHSISSVETLEMNLNRLNSDSIVFSNVQDLYMPGFVTGDDYVLSDALTADGREFSNATNGADFLNVDDLDIFSSPAFIIGQLALGEEDTMPSLQPDSHEGFPFIGDDNIGSLCSSNPGKLTMQDFPFTTSLDIDLSFYCEEMGHTAPCA